MKRPIVPLPGFIVANLRLEIHWSGCMLLVHFCFKHFEPSKFALKFFIESVRFLNCDFLYMR
jgi:hypothetical protein